MPVELKKAPATKRATPISKILRAQAEQVMQGNYAFMDSPSFNQPDIEAELFSEEEPVLPLVSWYQPTRDEMVDAATSGTPKLMSASEEKLMFLRYNFAKKRLGEIKERVEAKGLTKADAEALVHWQRRDRG